MFIDYFELFVIETTCGTCENGGVMSTSTGDCSCQCVNGYSGPRCESESFTHKMFIIHQTLICLIHNQLKTPASQSQPLCTETHTFANNEYLYNYIHNELGKSASNPIHHRHTQRYA